MVGTAIMVGVSVGLAVHANEQQKSAQRENKRQQEKANNIEQAKASVDRARARRKAIAQARVMAAQNEALASQQGIGAGSSTIQGAQGALTSNLAANIADANRAATSAQQSLSFRQAGENALATGNRRAGNMQALSGLMMQGASIYSQYASQPQTFNSSAFADDYFNSAMNANSAPAGWSFRKP